MDLTLNEISQIVDENKGEGFLSQWFVDVLSPLERRMKKLDADKSDFSINDVFISSKKNKETLEKKYQKTLGRLMTSLRGYSDFLDKESSVDPTKDKKSLMLYDSIRNLTNTITGFDKTVLKLSVNKGGEKNEDETKGQMSSDKIGDLADSLSGFLNKNIFKTYEDKDSKNSVKDKTATPKKEFDTDFKKESLRVHIQSIDGGVLKLLGGGEDKKDKKSKSRKESSGGSGGGMGFIKSLLGLATGLAGLWMLFQGFKGDGSMKGTLKILGTAAVTFLKSAVTGLLKPFTGFLFGGKGILPRFMGFVGGIMGKVFSTKGGNVKSLKGVTKGILPLMKSLFKKVLSKIPFIGTISKIFKGGVGALGKAGKFLTKLPIGIGAIISFAFAYSRFKKGDIIGGFLDVASGIASIIPVVGTALAIGIDLISAFRDGTTTREERKDSNVGGLDIMGKIGEIISGIGNWLVDKVMGTLYYVGDVVKNLSAYLWDGIKNLAKVAWKKVKSFFTGDDYDENADFDKEFEQHTKDYSRKSVMQRRKLKEELAEKKYNDELIKHREKLHKESQRNAEIRTEKQIQATLASGSSGGGGGNTTIVNTNSLLEPLSDASSYNMSHI